MQRGFRLLTLAGRAAASGQEEKKKKEKMRSRWKSWTASRLCS